jgi:hypothetical protein
VGASKQATERVVNVSETGDLPVVPGTSEHPDHDLLADLAAEVLADDLAEQVQTHVVACHSCAGLLGEAEGIRTLLRQGEPDRMPDDVLERLTAALSSSSLEEQTADVADAPALSAGVARVGSGTDPRRRLTPALPKNAAARAAATGDTGRIARLKTRMTTPTESARRQAREEELADRPSRLSRLAPLLKVAATVVVLLGVGGLVWNLLSGSTGGASSADSGGEVAASSAPVLAAVQTTGTNYSAGDLRKQVDTLIGTTQGAALKSSPAPSAADAGSASAESRQRQNPSAAALAAGADLLTSPAALRACLSAIGADDDQPVAVDLARWDDRDAAIIVLNADGGGYDVWVVARTCAANADGTIAQQHIDS